MDRARTSRRVGYKLLRTSREAPMPCMIRPSRRYPVRLKILIFFVLSMIVATSGFAAKDGRPFWTEKSSFIEGDELFVVGVASNSKTIEEARKQAFENGKLELMNFAQVTSLEARGLVIETQMTFEEPQANGTVTVYRLLRVPIEKLRAIQDNLRTQTVVQEHALEKAHLDPKVCNSPWRVNNNCLMVRVAKPRRRLIPSPNCKKRWVLRLRKSSKSNEKWSSFSNNFLKR